MTLRPISVWVPGGIGRNIGSVDVRASAGCRAIAFARQRACGHAAGAPPLENAQKQTRTSGRAKQIRGRAKADSTRDRAAAFRPTGQIYRETAGLTSVLRARATPRPPCAR